MRKKGQVVFVSIMIAVVVLVIAFAFAGPVTNQITNVRNETNFNSVGLNCSGTGIVLSNGTGADTISDFDRATCVVADLNIFYFIGGLIFIAGSIVAAKIIFA